MTVIIYSPQIKLLLAKKFTGLQYFFQNFFWNPVLNFDFSSPGGVPGIDPGNEIETPLDGRVDGGCPGDVVTLGAESVLIRDVVDGDELTLGRGEAVGAADHVAVAAVGALLLTEGPVLSLESGEEKKSFRSEHCYVYITY